MKSFLTQQQQQHMTENFPTVKSRFNWFNLGPVKSGSNSRLARLSKVIYIILQIGTDIKQLELLKEAYCN